MLFGFALGLLAGLCLSPLGGLSQAYGQVQALDHQHRIYRPDIDEDRVDPPSHHVMYHTGLRYDPILVKAYDLLSQGQGQNAKAVYEAYLQDHPNHPEASMALAWMAIKTGHWQEGRQRLEAAMTANPERGDVAALLGHLLSEWSHSPWYDSPMDYTPRATEYFRQAFEKSPKDPSVLAFYGAFQQQQNDRVSAERFLRLAIQADSAFLPAYHLLTRFLIAVEDRTGAKTTLFQVYELNPKNTETALLTAKLLALADHPETAIKYGLQSERYDFTQRPERDLLLAQQYEKLADLPKAKQHYENVLAVAPNHGESLRHLADIYLALGNTEDARAFFERAMEVDPTLLPELQGEAQTAFRLGMDSAALQQWRRLLSLKPILLGFQTLGALHFSNWEKQKVPQTEAVRDWQLFQQMAPPPNRADDAWQLVGIQLITARNGAMAPSLRQRLLALTNSLDDAVATESAYMMGMYGKALERVHTIDNKEPTEYLAMGDRLHRYKGLLGAETMYQRGQAFEPMSGFQVGLQRVNTEKAFATRAIDEGDKHFREKEYEMALGLYQKASGIFPEWETAYLRIGDTQQKLKNKAAAYDAFRRAVDIRPDLLNSEGFTKRYKKLESEYLKRHNLEEPWPLYIPPGSLQEGETLPGVRKT